MTRARAAVPLIVTYWLVLLLGLVLYTAARTDAPGMIGILWGGAIFGTLVGHTMGLADIRLWFTAVIVGGLALLGFLGPSSFDTKLFWMTFAPATISAALSVADRWSLAAFWFPAMIWMLTILDGTHGKARPDGIAGVLLGALAIAFVIFLRVRESRRVSLWRTVSTAPLANPAPTTVFKERPGKELGRAGWMLATSAITFTFTAWLAPQLWEVETFDGDPQVVSSANGPAGSGPPCCEDLLAAERSRVKEYFDFGRGRDELTGGSEEFCRQCGGGDDGDGGGGRFSASGMLICTDAEIDLGYCVPCTEDEVTAGLCEFGMWHFRGHGGGYGGGGGGGGGGAGGGAGGTGGVGGTGGTGGTGTGDGTGMGDGYSGDRYAAPSMPTPVIPSPNPEPIRPDIYEPIPTTPPVIPETPPEPIVMPEIKPEIPSTPPEPVAMPNVLPEPSVAPPQPEPPAPAPAAGTAPTKSNAPSPSANRAQRPAPSSSGSELMRWLSAFIAAIVALQLLRFLFRPLRRAIALRHLRKPFWEETIDQRVSNWWQLVLVGLRDAGWRTTADEAPREFAKRVGIDGVDKCAAILDRTRHGIRVDSDDLTEMSTSAEAAYRSARSTASTAARAAAQIRWPLA